VRALILQHIDCEPAAVYEDELRARGAEITVVEVDEVQAVPNWRDFDRIVAMGGPMGVYEDADHPWIRAELDLLGEAARAGRPVWGVCLGAQMLAAALGARVYGGSGPEVGIMPVDLTAEAAADPVFARATQPLPTLQWHGDTFDLPEGAVLLASSARYPNQAFRWSTSYGLQFHLEVSPQLASRWADVPAYGTALDRVHGPGSLPHLIADLEREGPAMNQVARAMFTRWLDQALPERDPTAAQAATLARTLSHPN
jgi:GMP synthase (glutamine-hydrolysing)